MSVILSIQTVHLRTKEMEDGEYRNSSPESADGTTVAVFTFRGLSATRKSTNICLQLLSVPFDSTSERRWQSIIRLVPSAFLFPFSRFSARSVRAVIHLGHGLGIPDCLYSRRRRLEHAGLWLFAHPACNIAPLRRRHNPPSPLPPFAARLAAPCHLLAHYEPPQPIPTKMLESLNTM